MCEVSLRTRSPVAASPRDFLGLGVGSRESRVEEADVRRAPLLGELAGGFAAEVALEGDRARAQHVRHGRHHLRVVLGGIRHGLDELEQGKVLDVALRKSPASRLTASDTAFNSVSA